MAHILKGSLYFKGTGKNRKRALKFSTPKNKTWNNEINPNKLSKELRESEEDNIDVELEFENGQPTQVWRLGAARPVTEELPASNGGDDMKPEFHNPYNFVPAPPRDISHPELGDHAPAGHDRYIFGMYSGKLRVKMTVKTPLLLPDTARMHYNNDHKSYPVRVDADGKPLIEPTAIKGMLRAAYEAVTNSRMGVFKDHDKELALRAAVEDGITVVPCRIEKSGSSMCVTLYTGFSDMEEDGGPKFLNPAKPRQGRQPMYAAWLRRYLNPHSRGAPMLVGVAGDDEHGSKVWAYVRKWRRGPFEFWNVVEIQPHSMSAPTTNPSETRSNWRDAREIDPSVNGIWVEGYICHNRRNIKRKHDERVFFNAPRSTPDRFLLNNDQWQLLAGRWETLIKDYIAAEHKGLDPGIVLSRHIDKKEFVLQEGSICYARVVKEGSQAHKNLIALRPGFVPLGEFSKGTDKWLLVELNPVMISRRLHEKSPAELLHESLHPADLITKLSPADRVFGWVRQASPDEKNLTEEEKRVKDVASYRGQIRIGTVQCKGIGGQENQYDPNVIQEFGQPTQPSTWLPLQILGQPKPQQGRFYVAKNKDGDAQDQGLSNEQAGYNNADKGLRGRKVYPHHATLPENYWIDASTFQNESSSSPPDLTQIPLQENGKTYFREYLRPNSDNRRDKQNRSIQGWVKPACEFEFDIHFTNLSEVELGGLIWLLTMNQPKEQKYFHRFGGGKPLGFGSVKLELTESEICSGEDLKAFYTSLETQRNSSKTVDDCKSAFEQAMTVDYPNAKFLEAFKRACEGFDDKRPIHYPRTRRYGEVKQNIGGKSQVTGVQFDPHQTEGEHPPPHKDGLSYEWFVENAKEKIEQKGVDANGNPITIELYAGKVVIKPRFPLDDLASDRGLPILPHKK